MMLNYKSFLYNDFPSYSLTSKGNAGAFLTLPAPTEGTQHFPSFTCETKDAQGLGTELSKLNCGYQGLFLSSFPYF